MCRALRRTGGDYFTKVDPVNHSMQTLEYVEIVTHIVYSEAIDALTHRMRCL